MDEAADSKGRAVFSATVLLETAPEVELPQRLELEGAVHQHLFRARRLAPGDRLLLVDGRGGRASARVAEVDRRRAEVVVEQRLEDEPALLPIDVWISQPKLERASWAVEKLTELGVASVTLWRSDRSQVSYAPRQVDRLGRVVRAALEQSGGARLPKVRCNESWEDLDESGPICVLDVPQEGVARPLEGLTGSLESLEGPIRLLVGPEGGWSDRERERFDAARWPRLSLGRRMLRVETAAVVGAGVLGWALGERGAGAVRQDGRTETVSRGSAVD